MSLARVPFSPNGLQPTAGASREVSIGVQILHANTMKRAQSTPYRTRLRSAEQLGDDAAESRAFERAKRIVKSDDTN
jgi:hypothetical protein